MNANVDPFRAEISERLSFIQSNEFPDRSWPEGCYGSAASWVVFVGPSPGGGAKLSAARGRVPGGGTPLWNIDYLDPVSIWSSGFRKSMKPILESATQLRFDAGAAKLYGFVNFHWQQNPDASYVQEDGMRSGADDVLRVLTEIRPRLIVPMEKRSHNLLRETLERYSYETLEPSQRQVKIQIHPKSGFHNDMLAYRIAGKGPLSESVVVKSPQHPARIFNSDYALRCGRAIRSCFEQVHSGKTSIFINEVIAATG